jgi:ComF family protein
MRMMLPGFATGLNWVGALGRVTLDAVLPPQCLVCSNPVQLQGQLCGACFGRIGFVSEPCCDRCGMPFAATAQGSADGWCAACIESPPPWGRARAALRYDEHSRRLILPFKHGGRTELSLPLARHMARAGAALLRNCDLIVPVPLHRFRLLARRFNQSALLARHLARLSGRVAVPDALVRLRATRSLAGMSMEERSATLSGVIGVRPSRRRILEGARVVLVDDVLTSGATAGACARALLAAGVLEVDVLAAARVPDPRQR